MTAPDFRRYLPFLIPLVIVLGVIGLVVSANRGAGDPWIEVGALEDLRSDGVLYSNEAKAFAVTEGRNILGLSEDAQHLSHPADYCESSGMFEAREHGEKFDRLGRYYGGPAASDMDRVAIKIDDGTVYVNPHEITETPNRSKKAFEPSGPFCAGP